MRYRGEQKLIIIFDDIARIARETNATMKFNIATMRRVRKFVYNYYYREKIHRLIAISIR